MKWFKRIGISLGIVVLAAGSFLGVMASRFEPSIRPNVFVGLVPIGGLTREDAAKKLRLWWETERRTMITLQNSKLQTQPAPMSLSQLGFSLDDSESVKQAPMDEFWFSAKRIVGAAKAEPVKLNAIYRFDSAKLRSLTEFVSAQSLGATKAKVTLIKGEIIRVPESSGLALNLQEMQSAIELAWKSGGNGELPLAEAAKTVPDEELAKISDVVTSFSTSFSTAKRTRCNNIKIASSKINGTVLMPGEQFSFNGTVGRRTIKDGFQIAGVYKNGKHDVDVGGGICQVSTTLYNAALLSNLAIKQRYNHSMPVAYVPLGRDATVDYGSRDLILENNTDSPIAITCEYQPGKLTFSILGKKDPTLSVTILSAGRRTWSAGVKYVTDASLAPGRTKTIDKGGIGASISTTRVVYRDGKEVSRESLGQSLYRGGQRIIARGPAARAVPKTDGAPGESPELPAEPVSTGTDE